VKSPKAEAESNGAMPAAAAVPSLGGTNGLLPGGAENVSVDKIRDLLFGNQMQDYDRRFSNMEDRFTQKLRDLEAETQRGLSAFESNSKKQVESVAGQLREEKDLRADADKEIERNLREQIQSLEKRVRQLSDQVGQLERDLSDRMTQESQSLREEIKRRNDDTRATIERMFAELSGVKTDRNLLAGLFVEVAKALNQDLGGKPGGDGSRGWHAG
jgi:DNA repair exonuclease SbcCD ATPase subunit